jgi:hypothetical protein
VRYGRPREIGNRRHESLGRGLWGGAQDPCENLSVARAPTRGRSSDRPVWLVHPTEAHDRRLHRRGPPAERFRVARRNSGIEPRPAKPGTSNPQYTAIGTASTHPGTYVAVGSGDLIHRLHSPVAAVTRGVDISLDIESLRAVGPSGCYTPNSARPDSRCPVIMCTVTVNYALQVNPLLLLALSCGTMQVAVPVTLVGSQSAPVADKVIHAGLILLSPIARHAARRSIPVSRPGDGHVTRVYRLVARCVHLGKEPRDAGTAGTVSVFA